MRSPLQLPDGRFAHALLTTYSFNLRFFEEWVLRALWAAEVRNVVVFVDPHQLGHALSDRAPSLAGRAYHVVAGVGAKAAFHPKVLLLSGDRGARLCVSSANLTADGQLRNAESAIAFDANLPGHMQPIQDAAEFFRRLAVSAPAHTAAAVQHAISAVPDDDPETGPFRFLHNLDRRLIDAFPATGPIRAIAPYVDADGTAARELHDRGELSVTVDGEHIVASSEFFAGPWTVNARRFDARLHGKAYEVTTPAGRWTLVGSPNLSEPGLLRVARAGNLEVAVGVTQSPRLELPASEAWDGDDVRGLAAGRMEAVLHSRDEAEAIPRAFNAWEAEQRIIVEGLPDGTQIDRWSNERWHPLGTVSAGAVLIADPEIRPTRIRAIGSDGKVAFAVVAQPALLRARTRARSAGRQTQATERLPLDLETLKALEETLAELYALSELAGEVRIQKPPIRGALPESPPSLLEWMPRNTDEEPRIPSLYRNNWKGEPDALLALVSRVLRLEPEVSTDAPVDLDRELIDVEDLENFTSAEQLTGEQASGDEPVVLKTQRDELERYQRAFIRLFDRGRAFIKSGRDPDLAGAGFVYLLHLVEKLATNRVEVDGDEEPLMPRSQLRDVSLGLLEEYLNRGERDPLCLATARAHLATAIRELHRFSVRDRERLEELAFVWAAELIAVSADVPGPRREDIGFDPTFASTWLGSYAERSDWTGIEDEAASRIGFAVVELSPFPTIIGATSFGQRTESPVWRLLAFAAPAGYASGQSFAIVLRNTGDSSLTVHVLACVPSRRVIIEAWQRTSDARWLVRHYAAPSQSAVEDMGGPFTMEVTQPVREYGSLEEATSPLSALAGLVAEAVPLFE